PGERQTVARLGFHWAKQSGDIDQLNFFSERLDSYPVSDFESAAARLEALEAWQSLKTIFNKTENLDLESQPGLYYSLLVELYSDPGEDFVMRVNEQLDRAVEAESVYGPRYQRLLGDYYYRQENYDRAAIEYHKVMLLFEENDQVPRARVKMARIYSEDGQQARAQKLYEQLTGENIPELIRKEAELWLEKNS
ncbi:MAG: tetratricopeptide repeat protein, partial [bacterium]